MLEMRTLPAGIPLILDHNILHFSVIIFITAILSHLYLMGYFSARI